MATSIAPVDNAVWAKKKPAPLLGNDGSARAQCCTCVFVSSSSTGATAHVLRGFPATVYRSRRRARRCRGGAQVQSFRSQAPGRLEPHVSCWVRRPSGLVGSSQNRFFCVLHCGALNWGAVSFFKSETTGSFTPSPLLAVREPSVPGSAAIWTSSALHSARPDHVS
jgi:hypothetical protein